MYRCKECGGRIQGIPGDPVHDLSKRGVICTPCLRKPEPAAPQAVDGRSARGAATKARWDAMPAKERAERMAKMRAGRAARSSTTAP